MDRQHVTRRIVLGTVMVGLAVLAMAGGGDTARAEVRGGWGDKASFKTSCEKGGGTFIDSPSDGLTACFWGDGSKTVCDTNGNDCIDYPPPPKKLEETSWADPIVADAPLVAVDTQTVAPVDVPLEAITEAPVDVPLESQNASAAESGTLGAAAEAPVARADEPVAVDVSAEQP